jgi:hypothetical protein
MPWPRDGISSYHFRGKIHKSSLIEEETKMLEPNLTNIPNNGRRPTSPLFQGSKKPQSQCIVIVPFLPAIFP